MVDETRDGADDLVPSTEEAQIEDEVLRAFLPLRERIKSSVRRAMDVRYKFPHHAAALLIAVGCEAVSRIRGRAPAEVFVEELILPHGHLDRAMADDLFRAVRHGLAHTFDGKYIQIGFQGPRIQLFVSRHQEDPHLVLRKEPTLQLCLNLDTMKTHLEQILDVHRADLEATTKGRRLPKIWRTGAIQKAQYKAIPGWERYLKAEGMWPSELTPGPEPPKGR